MIVVIPTAREICLDFLDHLIAYGAEFLIIDDTPGSIRINHPQFHVYNWNDRKNIMGEFMEAIPKGNGACAMVHAETWASI